MDLHRLRVVGFDTSVSKKADEKYNVELEKYEQGDWKTSTHRNNYEIGDVDQCRNGSNSPPRRLSNKCLRNKIPPETSNVFLGDQTSPLGTSAKINPNAKITRPGTSQKRRPGASNKCLPGTSKKYLDNISITSPPPTWKKRCFTIRKSKSEIFKIPPMKNKIKYDLKLNLSDTDSTEQFQDNAYSHQRKRTLRRKRNSRVHQKVQNAKESRDKNDVHFLYTRETPSFMRFCRKRAENDKTKTKNKRNCRLPNDIYGFHKSNRSMDQHLYQMSCFKFIDADKLPFKKIKMIYHRNRKPKLSQPAVEKCFCKHHAMRVLKSDHRKCEKPSICYNLNTRPHSRRFQRNYDYDQEQGEGKKPACLQCMGKDETVEVSPSKLSPEPLGFCDVGTSPSNVEQPASLHPQLPDVLEECLSPQTATVANEFSQKPSHPCLHNPIAARSGSAQNKCKKERTTKKFFIIVTNGFKGFFSRLAKHVINFHSKRELSGAGCVKYFCVGLLIVIWFPCLLAGVLAWVVFFPGKLINMVKCTSTRSFSINRCRRKDPRSEYQRMCFENYLPQQETSFISSVARWCTRTVGTVLNSFKAVISVFKFKRKEPRARAGSSCFHSSQIPRKRYTLFYVNNRGWVMKPLRRRKKRSVPRSRVVQNMRCDYIPKMTFFDNWQQTPPPSKDAYFVCPVNKKGRKKRRRSSRAGDAYQLRCTDQWPSCACGDENPPGLTQVNIPSIFSRSADQILSKNKKCNSEVFADYIAQEDLAKNHLGQPKNGTCPFGFDFNYPYRTKHPLIMNLETYGANQFGLGDDEKIASSKGLINSMQSKYIRSCKLNRLRTQVVNRWIDSNYPFRKNRITALTNKKLCSQRKILPMRNKSVLAALSKSALIKDANTSTHKVYFAHKAQNTKHIPYQKVINKCNKMKNSNLNLTTTKKTYKCKKNPSQKYLSTAKIKSNVKPNTVVNSSFINLNNLSKRGGEYKPHHKSVATQKQANTTNTRISADHNKALHHFYRHDKQSDKCEPHRMSATHKQSNIKRNIEMHRPSTYNQSKQNYTKIPHNISPTLKQSNTNRNIASHHPSRHEKFRQATHKQSNTSDIMAKVKRNLALISPHEDKRLYQTRHIPVAIQMKPDTTNNMTMTSRDVLLDDPPEQYKQGCRHEPRQIPVATQIQPQIADNATITSHDVALNCPSGEKHEKSKQIYKYQIPFATQIQSQIANKVTMTTQDVALNCPSGEKHEQSKQFYKSQQIPVASQVYRNTADKTKSTFCDSYALNDPLENKHVQYKQRYRHGPRKIPFATQTKLMKADNITMTSRDVGLSCHDEVKPSTATKGILCLPRTAYKNTSASKLTRKCVPSNIPVATQMQSNTIDITTMTSRDVDLNHVCGHAQSIQANKYTASNNRDIASNFFGGVKPSTPNKELLCITKTAEKDTIYPQNHSSLEVHPKRNISIQKQDFKIGASECCYDLATQSTQISRVAVNRSKLKVECKCRTTPTQNKADKKTATTHNTQPNLTRVPSHTLQEMPKSFVVSERQNISQTTPFIEKQEFTSDPATPSSHPDRIVRETATSTTDIQKLPWVCKCACSEFRQHPLIAQQLPQRTPKITLGTEEPKVQPDVPKIIKTLSKSLKSPEDLPSKISQATNTIVTPQRSKFDKEMDQITNQGETYKTGLAKEPSKLFDLAASCVCGANHGTEAQAMHPQSRNNNSQTTPLANMKGLVSNQEAIVTKSSTFPTNLEAVPCDCKCECNFLLSSSHHDSQAKHSSQHTLKTALAADKLSVKPDILEVNKTLSKSLKSPEHLPSKISQATNTIVTPQRSKFDKEMDQITNQGETYKTGLAKEPSKLFDLAASCVCGANHGTEAQAMHPQSRNNNSQTTPLANMKGLVSNQEAIVTKSSTFPTNLEAVPCDCKCECNFLLSSSHHDSQAKHSSQHTLKTALAADKLSVKPDILEVNKTLSKSLKSPEHLPSKISQATNTIVTPQRSKFDKEMDQITNQGETYKTGLAKEPSKLFDLAASCVCGANHGTEAQAMHPQSRNNNSQTTPLANMKGLVSNQEAIVTKSSTFPTNLEAVPCDCKCECNFLLSSSHHDSQAKHSSQHTLKTALAADKLSVKPDMLEVNKTLSKSLKSPEHLPFQISQSTSPLFGIASDCHCEETPLQNESDKENSPLPQKSEADSKKRYIYKTSSPKAPLSQKPELTKVSEQSFGIATDCSTCGTNQPVEVEKNLHNKLTASKYHTEKETLAKSSLLLKKTTISKFPITESKVHKSSSSKEPQSLKTKRRPYAPNIQSDMSKVNKDLSNFPKSPENATPLKSKRSIEKVDKSRTQFSKLPDCFPQMTKLHQKCPCQVSSEILQDPVSERLYGTRELRTASKKNIVKVDKSMKNVHPIPECLKCTEKGLGKCPCPIESLQYLVSEKTRGTTERTIASKNNTEKKCKKNSSFNLLQSKQLIDKIRYIPDIKSAKSHDKRESKNKHGKRENVGIQTAPIISGKCACWPDKLHQFTKKLSNYSRKSVEKISPSQPTPGHQPSQPYSNSHQPNVGTEAHTVNPQHLPIRQPSQVFQLKQLKEKVGKPFATINQLIKPDQAIPIIAGRCGCAGEQNNKTKHSSNNNFQPEADLKKLPSSCQHIRNTQPVSKLDSLHSSRFIEGKVDKQLDQLFKTDRVLPIIPGRCRCAGEQKIKTEYSSNNKLQPPTVQHPAHKATLRTDMQSELTQRQNQLRASKLWQPQPHTSTHTGIILNAHNSQPTRKKSCKCRSFKNEYEQEVWVNSLHKIAKTQSPFLKSQLDSCMYSDFAKNTLRRQHTILQRSEIPQILKKSQIQLNPQFQQIQRDQKLEPEIPIHLEKPPPELLQRNWAGHGQNRTAEGGVRQPYPDFNRVSMRYPGQTAPCNTNSASRCGPKSPNDESALRRAYKRRPLRCTPPREQKDCRRQKANANSQTICITKKQMKKATGIRGFCRCLRDAVHDAEQDAWPTEFSCNPWVNTLKRKPCFWIYKTWPRAYPAFLCICNGWNAIRRLFTLCLTFCFWSPLALCFYLCCNLLCRR